MKQTVFAVLILGVLLVPSCTQVQPQEQPQAPGGVSIEGIQLPSGFSISRYSQEVPGARSLAHGADGTVFVSTRDEGNVYALTDADGDGVAERVRTIASGLDSPNGIAFRGGSLYIAEITRISRLDAIETRLDNPPQPVPVYTGLPSDRAHGWKYLAFGPDGKLYVPVGMPCNACAPREEIYGTILRMNPDGSGMEIYARGIRNTVGFDWNPATGELWFTDNGRDRLGDDVPPDELNRAPGAGLHFGFPYIHGQAIRDPEFGSRVGADFRYERPVRELGPHVAALGMKFYRGTLFPAEYRGMVFIAEHGSWNRTVPIGYRVMLVRLQGNRAVSYEPFAAGWLSASGNVSGRPVDVLELPDGSLLVSDDRAGAVYRITYGR